MADATRRSHGAPICNHKWLTHRPNSQQRSPEAYGLRSLNARLVSVYSKGGYIAVNQVGQVGRTPTAQVEPTCGRTSGRWTLPSVASAKRMPNAGLVSALSAGYVVGYVVSPLGRLCCHGSVPLRLGTEQRREGPAGDRQPVLARLWRGLHVLRGRWHVREHGLAMDVGDGGPLLLLAALRARRLGRLGRRRCAWRWRPTPSRRTRCSWGRSVASSPRRR